MIFNNRSVILVTLSFESTISPHMSHITRLQHCSNIVIPRIIFTAVFKIVLIFFIYILDIWSSVSKICYNAYVVRNSRLIQLFSFYKYTYINKYIYNIQRWSRISNSLSKEQTSGSLMLYCLKYRTRQYKITVLLFLLF